MLFKDRKDAGIKLAQRLEIFAHDKEMIVLALPRGGVIVGYEIAKALELPLDIICPRKIGAPGNPEFALGAITETGEGVFSEDVLEDLHISEKFLNESIEAESKEAKRRLTYYRGNRAPRDLHNKKVLLVDDGLATGSTMMAAIKSIQKEGAKELIVAVPVSPIDSAEKVAKLVDQFFCLATPPMFYAIGQFYERFDQTSDEEVIEKLKQSLKT